MRRKHFTLIVAKDIYELDCKYKLTQVYLKLKSISQNPQFQCEYESTVIGIALNALQMIHTQACNFH